MFLQQTVSCDLKFFFGLQPTKLALKRFSWYLPFFKVHFINYSKIKPVNQNSKKHKSILILCYFILWTFIIASNLINIHLIQCPLFLTFQIRNKDASIPHLGRDKKIKVAIYTELLFTEEIKKNDILLC